MAEKDLEKKWDKKMKEAFDSFIEENVGYKPKSGTPECYGSGDDELWCRFCFLRPSC